MTDGDLETFFALYREMRPAIVARLAAFRATGQGADEALFAELCFCLLAVQANARHADEAVRTLQREGLLLEGTAEAIAPYLRKVRFLHTKARWIVAARNLFRGPEGWTLRRRLDGHPSPQDARAWLADRVVGFQFKEASHFLRNIGRGEDLAILDRHILRGLVAFGVLADVPPSLSRARYLAVEAAMARFADDVGLPFAHLDLLLWSRETGEVFK
jgi:N-glycosylase/DNA lyase